MDWVSQNFDVDLECVERSYDAESLLYLFTAIIHIFVGSNDKWL